MPKMFISNSKDQNARKIKLGLYENLISKSVFILIKFTYKRVEFFKTNIFIHIYKGLREKRFSF